MRYDDGIPEVRAREARAAHRKRVTELRRLHGNTFRALRRVEASARIGRRNSEDAASRKPNRRSRTIVSDRGEVWLRSADAAAALGVAHSAIRNAINKSHLCRGRYLAYGDRPALVGGRAA